MTMLDDAFRIGYLFGIVAHGILAGEPIKERRQHDGPMDDSIKEFLMRQSIVYMDDLIGHVGLTDDRGNRIAVGSVMRRLGWIRRREAPPSRRWFYERGSKAVV